MRKRDSIDDGSCDVPKLLGVLETRNNEFPRWARKVPIDETF